MRISLRHKFIFYLVFVHLLFAGTAAYVLAQNRIWLVAIEGVFITSLSIGVWLVHGLFGAIDRINAGAEFIKDGDFNSRFREVGHPDMDRLINIYNRMADHLREERIRLREHHYLMESILKVSPSGIITLDFDGRIAMVNPVAGNILQSSSDGLLGKRLSELESPFGVALAGLSPEDAKIVSLWGGRKVKCRRAEFMDRGFRRSLIAIEELTEELRQTEKSAYEKLIRVMSHEVNNSTGAVNSLLHSCLHYANQIREDDRKDFETAVSVAINRTGQLNSFMRSFADVVRLPPPKPVPCNLTELLQELAVLMSQESAKKKVEWRWMIDENPEWIAMDRIQMEQVFVNIFKNSLEAVDHGGVIAVAIGRKDGRVFTSIEDSGHGMTEEIQSNLFVPFFSTKPNGQGIGLTLVKEILIQHHFDFAVETCVGGPTRFSIYF
jgi:two-component system, NtrC family, nitrogen regulation sensor histidine kinase NtrY